MATRLVLGCGSVGHAVLGALSDGGGKLRVLDPDPERVETLRNEMIPAQRADVTDPAVVGEKPADVVFVGGDGPGQNVAAANAARAAHPEAYLVAYTGVEPTPAQRDAVRDAADRVVDRGAAVVDDVEAAVESGTGRRARRLRETVTAVDGTLGVFMHDNPDPDAIASAVALVEIADSLGVDARACYYGDISHQENRAFVNLLDLDVAQLDADADISEFAGFALVDHSRPGVNDQLPPDLSVDVVIDHHPPKEEITAEFVDLRGGVGATSTLLTEYVEWFDLDLAAPSPVATGLLYGIRVDTKDFAREISEADFEAAAYLLPHVDVDVLDRVESPSVNADTFDTIARAIRNRQTEGPVLASCVGAIADRDALAQAADRLLMMEGITTTLVYGFNEGMVYVSARSRHSDVDLGGALREAFAEIGSAGGHQDMAGAQIPLGLFGEMEREAEHDLTAMVRNVVSQRFFETMRGKPAAPTVEADVDE